MVNEYLYISFFVGDSVLVGGCSLVTRWRSRDSTPKPSTYSSWTLFPEMTTATNSQTTNGSYIKTRIQKHKFQRRQILRPRWTGLLCQNFSFRTNVFTSSPTSNSYFKKTTLLHNRYFYAYFLPLRKGPVLLVDPGGLLLPGCCPPDKSPRVHRADSGADGIKVCFSDAWTCGAYGSRVDHSSF